MGELIKGPWDNTPPLKVLTDPHEAERLATQALVVELSEAVFDGVRYAGFDISDESCYTNDLALICESIRSYINKLQGHYHVMQDVAEGIFVWDDEEQQLKFRDSIEVDFLPQC